MQFAAFAFTLFVAYFSFFCFFWTSLVLICFIVALQRLLLLCAVVWVSVALR